VILGTFTTKGTKEYKKGCCVFCGEIVYAHKLAGKPQRADTPHLIIGEIKNKKPS
jgi:hypothetical protein